MVGNLGEFPVWRELHKTRVSVRRRRVPADSG